jgi:alkanesulfonate monooxygenase
MHIVTGGAPGDQYREGDYLDHDSRYQRSMEYVDIMKRVWQGTEPFDVETNYYKFDKVRQLIKPYNQAIPIYMGGASDAALEFGARHADCYMLWGEPLASVSDRLNAIRQAARAVGHQPPQFSLSLRLYVGSSSSEAWERATADLPHVSQTTAAKQRRGPHAEDTGRTRQLQFAQEREVHDTCLWMGIALATGGQGNTAALVGTEDQILQALQAYADLGIHAFLISGASGYWDPLLADTAKRMRHELQVRALT